ncbi:cupredoxin domain-containing protein [Paenibacillus thalictri]|uniref:Cytochrome C oxidase subunit II n=1 Tax=Paenibacillus thalictri TaxID=2527873 RepID=A0A4Q9DIC0_9BACL|nr:cupredoxin domain-containing protein [Paenibacillus thalictri]TBL71415.1 cytochrome C oxidase subunit II [Paenibacillus thalictri]
MKKLMMFVMAVTVVIALSACGGKEAAPASGSAAGAAGGSAQELKLEATNFQFDKTEYHVKKGQDIKVSLDNKQGMHAVEIKGLNVKLEGGKSQTFKADKEGTYEIVCTLPCGSGHINMKSKLIVEA